MILSLFFLQAPHIKRVLKQKRIQDTEDESQSESVSNNYSLQFTVFLEI